MANESTTKKLSAASIQKLSFEESIKTLEILVRRLESGNDPLEDAIDHYETGMLLKSHCEKKLAEAKLRVEKIVAGSEE